MMKLEIAVLAGAESKQFLVDLTKQIDRLEALNGGVAKKKTAAPAATLDADEDIETETTEDDEDFAPAKSKKAPAKKAAASFDDDDDAPVEETEETEDEDFTTPAKAPAKKAAAPKAKKLTVDDVNDACKARAAQTGGKEGRNEVLTILKKKFKTTSVSELKPEQYAAVIEAMQA